MKNKCANCEHRYSVKYNTAMSGIVDVYYCKDSSISSGTILVSGEWTCNNFKQKQEQND